jgi:hypothetical protein
MEHRLRVDGKLIVAEGDARDFEASVRAVGAEEWAVPEMRWTAVTTAPRRAYRRAQNDLSGDAAGLGMGVDGGMSGGERAAARRSGRARRNRRWTKLGAGDVTPAL